MAPHPAEAGAASPIRLCVFGAPIDSGNLGLSALGLATLSEIARRIPDVHVSLFDHRRGVRPLGVRFDETELRGDRRGAWISRRVYRGESLWTMRAASRFAPTWNDNVRAIDAAAGVLDISGGDSFADLYGRQQLDLVILPKQIALQRRRPLVLLPQTFGPFRTRRSVRVATEILDAADQVWARDQASHALLQELLASRYDARRHRCGVDVAFALPERNPGPRLGDLADWFVNGDPVIGLNISGLLAADGANDRFGLPADYLDAMVRLVRRLLADTGLRVLLVPHVRGSGNESDDAAGARLVNKLDSPSRVASLPAGLGVDETKHVIARLAWFAGARMHATIAALSSRVPVVGIAYSDKFQGVFDGCGVGHRVLDARRLSAQELADRAFAAWEERSKDAEILVEHLPAVEATVGRQFDEIVAAFLPTR
jgi:colanic acid/amylovoran biosynthesis protein